jgi:hypothetical protein
MASIENLEIVVDVDISSALAALDELQSELRDLADTINDVDTRGTEGIDINTSLDDLDGELAALETELETFEETAEVEIPVEYDIRNFDTVQRRLHNLREEDVSQHINVSLFGDDEAESNIDRLTMARETQLHVRTSVDDISDDLAELHSEIETFERSARIEIPVEYDVRNLSAVKRQVRDLDGETVDATTHVSVQGERRAREKVDTLSASREAPLTIHVSAEGLQEELARVRTEVEAFERATDIHIPVELDVSNIDRVTNTLRNIQSTTARPSVDFDVTTDALDEAEQRLSSMASDLGLDGMEDGELSVRNMKVAAARVTVIGDGDEGAAEALNDVLRSFSVDVGGEDTRDIQVDERDLSGVKKPLTGPGFLTMSSPTAADDDELREGMGMLFGDDEEDMFPDIGQQLAEASANARTTSAEAIPEDVRDRLDELGVSTREVTDAMERRATFLGGGDTEGTPFEGIFENLDERTSRANRILNEPGTGGLSGSEARELGFEGLDDFDRQLLEQADFDAGEVLRDADFDLEAEMEMIPDDATGPEIGEHIADRLGGGDGRFGRGGIDFDFERGDLMPSMPDFGFDDDRSMGRRALGGVMGKFDDLGGALSGFDLRMSDIHNAMARLVPMLLIFIGVIPAAVTAVLGLAAAAVAAAAGLAALTGLGAMGLALEDGQFNMDNLRDAIEDIKSDFIEAFAPLAERLQPLFEDALDGLSRFFEAVAGEGDALVALTDEARAFGGFLMDFVPMLLNAMASMADALSPILSNIGEWMRNNLHDVTRTLVKLTAQAAPVIADLAMKIGRMLPALVQMSIGFAKVASIILSLIGMLGRFLGLLGLTPRLFGLIAAGALAAASAILLANSALIGLIVKGVVTLASAVYSFFVPAVATLVAGFTSSAVATYIATAALASFITLATLGAGLALVAAATSAAASFLGLADSIGKASDNLKEYNRISGRTDDDGPNPYNQGVRGANLGGGGSRGGNVTVIESNGDNEQARSDGAYAAWRQGRTTGDSP